MAYDIGQGISDAFGSIAEGMVTRKERQEERQKLIGQHETIEEDLRSEFQSLLDKGAGENVVKAAQTEYEKWSKRGDELSDESTKKIEGIISEYDKGEVRKSKRLQNRMAELQIDFANETNDYRKGKIEQDFLTAKLTNEATQQKQKDRKSLTEFISGYEGATSKQVADTESYWEDTSTPEFYYKQFSDERDMTGADVMGDEIVDPGSGFKIPKDSPRGRELMGQNLQEGEINPYLSSQAPNPYDDISNRNAFGLQEDPNMGYVPDWKSQHPFFQQTKRSRDIMRDPTTSEQAAAAQDYLSRSAGKLGPEGYKKAEAHVQSRHPRAAQGARIEIAGETLPGKVKVGDNIITVPRGQGVPMIPAGFRAKGVTYGTDKEGNQTTSVNLERYVKAEQPEFVRTAKMIADGDGEVKLVKELAPTPGMAKEFNDVYSDATQSIKLVEEVMDLVKNGREGGDRPNWLTLSAPWPLGDRELQAEITTRVNLMKGKLRLAVIGPGAVSEYEQKMLKDVIANPTKFFSLTTTNLAKLKTLKTIMDRSIKVKGAALGLFEYNPEREAGLRPMTGEGSDLASRTFGSVDEATSANLPAGTEVYIDDPENLGRRRHVIPETRRTGIPENPMYR